MNEIKLHKRKLYLVVALLCLLSIIVGACTKANQDATNLEDKTWVLESYGKQGSLQLVLEGTEITAIFDSTEKRVHGSSGCNSYGGAYKIDGGTLSISEVFYTEMACLEPEGIMEQEDKYLRAIIEAESYNISDSKLTIIAGSQVLIYSTE